MATTIKQWQIDNNILSIIGLFNLMHKQKCLTYTMIKMVIPIGWQIKLDGEHKFIERKIQCKLSDINNVYMATKNNDVHILNYYINDDDNEYVLIRLNLLIDKSERVLLV